MVQRRVGACLLLVLVVFLATTHYLPATLAAPRGQARPTVPAGRPTVAAPTQSTAKPPEQSTPAAPTATSVAVPTSVLPVETATSSIAATAEVPTVAAVSRALPRTGEVADPLLILYLILTAGSLAIGALLAAKAQTDHAAEE